MGLMTGDGGHEQNTPTVSLFLHFSCSCLRKKKTPGKVYLHYFAKIVGLIVKKISEKRYPCIGDRDINFPEPAHGFFNHGLNELNVGGIAVHGNTDSIGPANGISCL